MHRRLIAAALTLVLLLAGAEGLFGAHTCPHHSPATAVVTPGGDHTQHGAPGESRERETGCTCVGSCATPPSAALPAGRVRDALAAEISSAVPCDVVPSPPRTTRPPYLLPYSLAPPNIVGRSTPG